MPASANVGVQPMSARKMSGADPALAASVYFLSAPSNGTRSVLTVMPGVGGLPRGDLLLQLDVLDVALGVPERELALVGERRRRPRPRRPPRRRRWPRRTRRRWRRCWAPSWRRPTSRRRPGRPRPPRGRLVEDVDLSRCSAPLSVIGYPDPRSPKDDAVGVCRRLAGGPAWSTATPAIDPMSLPGHLLPLFGRATAPVEPRTTSRVSSRRCSGLAWRRPGRRRAGPGRPPRPCAGSAGGPSSAAGRRAGRGRCRRSRRR